MKLSLSRAQVEEIFKYALESRPAECCGLVGGTDDGRATSIYPLTNVASERTVGYEAAPRELFVSQREMRQRNEQLVAIYHSHPRAIEPQPSETDIRQAFYPSAIYLIVGLAGAQPSLRAFVLSERDLDWQAVEYAIRD